MIYGLIIRNRLYFVVVCRYINEHRALFLASQPLGFTNSSGMYVDSSKPLYFDWLSWQSFLAYITALLNAVLIGMLIAFALDGHAWRWWLGGTLGLCSWLFQVGLGIAYLRSREKMAGSDAVFGGGKER